MTTGNVPATLALALLAIWARRRHGAAFALAILAIASLDPGWLAQARYATTDIGHAVGWWLAALGLFTQPNINSLAWMALSLLLFQAAPAGWLFFTRNRQN